MKMPKYIFFLFSVFAVCCTNRQILRISDWEINIDQSNLGNLTRLRYQIDCEFIRISKLLVDDSTGELV